MRTTLFKFRALTIIIQFFVVLFFLFYEAMCQYDFNGDGVDELLSFRANKEAKIVWELIDTHTFKNDFFSEFGEVDDQVAPGYWLNKNKASIAVITHGTSARNDIKFRIVAPLDEKLRMGYL